SPTMKTLTLLAAITSFSAYTLVGVHAAKCVVCPFSAYSVSLRTACRYTSGGVTTCQ
ncbi:hypothetical protein PAXRUDRAFT_176549, partial [Paxillus rubicundulus Ve08.2h10]